VGSGFRAQTVLRVCAALPDWFDVVGVAARNAAARAGLAASDLVGAGALHDDVASLLRAVSPDVVFVTLPAGPAQGVIAELAAAGVPALTETPAAGTLGELRRLQALVDGGACVHVAEQYHLEPLVFAQLAVAASGRLGRVTDAHVNVAHDYHGLSVLRRALGVGFEEARVTARRDARRVQPSPSRWEDPDTTELTDTVHALAWLDYRLAGDGPGGGDRLGVYEFDDVQYRSWVRSPSLVIRGERGEVRDEVVRYVPTSSGSAGEAPRPVRSVLERVAAGGAGSHEGLFLRGYGFEGGWAYVSPFRPARLADDELSIAAILARMLSHVREGAASPYEVAEAAQDQYLQLVVRRAAEAGTTVLAERQPWADSPGCRHTR
jgi:predicted dehydrogenase